MSWLSEMIYGPAFRTLEASHRETVRMYDRLLESRNEQIELLKYHLAQRDAVSATLSAAPKATIQAPPPLDWPSEMRRLMQEEEKNGNSEIWKLTAE